MNAWFSAALLGAATGSRTTAGIAAVALSSRSKDGRTAGRLGSRPGQTVAALAALGELVADKLPATPSRLDPPGLPMRMVSGAFAAAVLAQRRGVDSGLPAVVGCATAGAVAYLGVRWRALATRRFGADIWGALIEDGVAAGLAVTAVRR